MSKQSEQALGLAVCVLLMGGIGFGTLYATGALDGWKFDTSEPLTQIGLLMLLGWCTLIVAAGVSQGATTATEPATTPVPREPQQAAPPPNPALGWVVLLAGAAVLAWSVVFFTGGSKAQYSMEPTTWPHKLAQINAGHPVPVTDPTIHDFEGLLANWKQTWPKDSEEQLCDSVVATWNTVKEKESLSLLEFSRHFERAADAVKQAGVAR